MTVLARLYKYKLNTYFYVIISSQLENKQRYRTVNEIMSCFTKYIPACNKKLWTLTYDLPESDHMGFSALLTLNPVTGMIELHLERLVCSCLINLGLPADNCMSISCKTLNVGCAIMFNLRNAMTWPWQQFRHGVARIFSLSDNRQHGRDALTVENMVLSSIGGVVFILVPLMPRQNPLFDIGVYWPRSALLE